MKSSETNPTFDEVSFLSSKDQLMTHLLKPEDSESGLERKLRTRKLIDMGGLVIKAGLGSLQPVTLYGALLTLNSSLAGKSKEKVFEIFDYWTLLGKQGFTNDKGRRERITLSFKEIPTRETLDLIKKLGLKWNNFRKEWEGVVTNLDVLKEGLGSADFNLQII